MTEELIAIMAQRPQLAQTRGRFQRHPEHRRHSEAVIQRRKRRWADDARRWGIHFDRHVITCSLVPPCGTDQASRLQYKATIYFGRRRSPVESLATGPARTRYR